MPPSVLYLVHDVYDAGVHKRARMLKDGGATVHIAGFRRHHTPLQHKDFSITDLGRTHNARLAHRFLHLLKTCMFIFRHRTLFQKADIIVCRNLEMLLLAKWAVFIFRYNPKIHYELLDIHTLLFNSGMTGKILRSIEGLCTRNIQSVLTSSQGFIDTYIIPISKISAPVYLIENKIYPPLTKERVKRISTPPWTIGLFGMLRCHKSVDILMHLAAHFPDKINIILAGKPALDQIPDFYDRIESTKNVSYLGSYKAPEDLENLYAQTHFTWAIDLYEDGLNSKHLLPNRLYEGSFFSSLPIARANTQTADWLAQHKYGIILNDPLPHAAICFFESLDVPTYEHHYTQIERISESLWQSNTVECRTLVDHLMSPERIS